MPLQMEPGELDERGTESLQRIAKRLRAKNHGDLSSAVISAEYYARKLGKTMYVYAGNSFGSLVWRVSQYPSDYLNAINNTGDRMASVTPDLIMAWHSLSR